MKLFSDNLLMLMLVFVMGFSPIQNAFASASECMMMDQNMQGQMEMTSVGNSDINDANNNKECCEQHECATTHCASVVAISNNEFTDVIKLDKVFYISNNSLISSHASTLFRPPKI